MSSQGFRFPPLPDKDRHHPSTICLRWARRRVWRFLILIRMILRDYSAAIAMGPAVAAFDPDIPATAVCLVTMTGPLAHAAVSSFQTPLYFGADRGAGAA